MSEIKINVRKSILKDDSVEQQQNNKAREEIDLMSDEDDDYMTKNLSLQGQSGYENCFSGSIKGEQQKPVVSTMSLRDRALQKKAEAITVHQDKENE